MADYMNFPKRWEDFLHDYEFEDSRRIYTNGSRLIPSFRVKQMLEHYLPVDVAPVRHGRWETMHYEGGILDGTNFDKCSVCGYERIFEDEKLKTAFNYCPNCGARMHEEVTK